MTPEQKEAVSEALIEPERQALEEKKAAARDRHRYRRNHRRRGSVALLGFFIGSALGYALTASLFLGGLIGLSVGFILAALLERFGFRED